MPTAATPSAEWNTSSNHNGDVNHASQMTLTHQFGRRSERMTADQLQFGLDDLEQTAAEHQAAQDAVEAAGNRPSESRATRPVRTHGSLPSHLPRYEEVIDVEHGACPCCGGEMHCIGELRTEQLDIAPAQLRVRGSTHATDMLPESESRFYFQIRLKVAIPLLAPERQWQKVACIRAFSADPPRGEAEPTKAEKEPERRQTGLKLPIEGGKKAAAEKPAA